MSSPLCPALYRRLEERFGTVHIANEGEKLITTGVTSAILSSRSAQGRGGTGTRPREEVLHAGEYYRVCCPKCRDTRYRLWINHRAHQYPWLVVCYNEKCYGTVQARDALLFSIFNSRPPKNLKINPGREDSGVLAATSLPDGTVPLRNLPLSHHANDYLDSRGYDPWVLSDVYGVGYCSSSQQFPQVSDRIVIPIHMEGKLVGWQGRYIGEENWKSSPFPKYYGKPGMPKRLMLYNHDVAASHPFVVIEEGTTDVWSTGPMAMGLLGKTISFTQGRILAFEPFRRKPIVLMLDPDAYLETEAAADELRQTHPGGLVVVNLPDGMDPGKFTPEVNLSLIHAAAKEQGVKLS